DLARQMTHLPVRIGAPAGFAGLPDELRTPDNATGVGMLRWALKGQWVAVEHGDRRQQSSFMERIMRWLQNLLPD
ncbi:MAG: cell division protein FtsA, partial [Anaerolineae bacterium]|nr:cell division protein FtsA [Anaerolineae bacterium]